MLGAFKERYKDCEGFWKVLKIIYSRICFTQRLWRGHNLYIEFFICVCDRDVREVTSHWLRADIVGNIPERQEIFIFSSYVQMVVTGEHLALCSKGRYAVAPSSG